MDDNLRLNALDDLLNAERHFRRQVEGSLRELRGVLIDLAQRLAGTQIEAARKSDPGAPENWSPQRWREFFASLPTQAAGSGWMDDLLAELEQLKDENRAFKKRFASSSSSSAPTPAAQSERPAAAALPALPGTADLSHPDSSPVVDIDPQGRRLAHADLLRDLRTLQLPASLPARFASQFPKAGLDEGDGERQVRCRLYVLYLLSRGMDTCLEVDYLVSQAEGVSARSGALRRMCDSLVEKGLLKRDVLHMSAPNTSLATFQLTEDGRQLCRILDWGVAETERQRLNRLREGVKFCQHTLAVLLFTLHARFHGCQAGVLPQLAGAPTEDLPDVSISRNTADEKAETLYVEVEVSNKGSAEKWQRQAQLQGRAAFCARDAQSRARLVGDCKLKNLPGVATDLETLIACKVLEISPGAPLWVEEW